jgi:hypothetical protein
VRFHKETCCLLLGGTSEEAYKEELDFDIRFTKMEVVHSSETLLTHILLLLLLLLLHTTTTAAAAATLFFSSDGRSFFIIFFIIWFNEQG